MTYSRVKSTDPPSTAKLMELEWMVLKFVYIPFLNMEDTGTPGLTRKNNKKSNRYCSVPQCQSKIANNISLHKFPEDENLKEKWKNILKIGKQVTKWMYVCSLHFRKEDYILPDAPTKQPRLKKGAVPSLKIPVRSHDKVLTDKQKKKIKQREERLSKRRQIKMYEKEANEVLELVCNGPPEVSEEKKRLETNEEISEPMEFLINSERKEGDSPKTTKDEEIQVNVLDELKAQFCITDLIELDWQLNCFTGLSSFSELEKLYKACKIVCNNITVNNIVLFLIKLKLNLSFRCLSVMFKVTAVTCKNIFNRMVSIMHVALQDIIYWPTKEEIEKNMPVCFKSYSKTRVVLDCTEIKIQKSKCLKCRIQSYSYYKGTHTAKYLVGIAPSGLITLISEGFGGRVSDKEITKNSGVMSKVEAKIDSVMADKGFLIADLCAEAGVELIRPPFCEGGVQFSEEDALLTNEIAKARVHVERAIQRIKIFTILNGTAYPFRLLKHLDKIMFIIGALVNLSPPIIEERRFKLLIENQVKCEKPSKIRC